MHTLVILDWDDTLFPTSWVVRNRMNLRDPTMTAKYTKLFARLDQLVASILHRLKEYGEVTIITNAMLGWIGICLNVLPKTQAQLEHVDLVSARENYQHLSEHVPTWKKEAFEVKHRLHLADNLDGKVENILSLGDADYEHQALIQLYSAKGYIPKRRLLKSIRFVTHPDHETVIDQLHLFNRVLTRVVETPKHVELRFSRHSFTVA